MPQNKKQHYIPKFYMKNFSDFNGRVNVLNLRDKQIYENVPYKNQGYNTYYYGLDTKWEKILSNKEQIWATSIKSVLNNDVMSMSILSALKEFAVYQRERSFANKQYRIKEQSELLFHAAEIDLSHKGIPYSEAELMKNCEEIVSRSIKSTDYFDRLESFVSMINDLKVLKVLYNTERSLIASDVPVIAINPFYKTAVGYGMMGLIIFFPVSPNCLIVLYDRKMYPHFSEKETVYCDDEEEVHSLNVYQLISAEKILYSTCLSDLCDFSLDEWNCRYSNRDGKATTTLGPLDNKLIITQQRSVYYECTFSFAKITHRFCRIPEACREAAFRWYDKAWEDKLVQKSSIMKHIWATCGNNMDDFGSPEDRKLLLRGYRQMANAACFYWNQQ